MDDPKESAAAEEILGNALGYFIGLLEDPNIWASDMMMFSPTMDNTGLEDFVTNQIFT